ncbi:hypothetical protein GALMADRAFT_54559 [Galerina marginata CBS 339.88]|uniref:Pre-rRNA-processing protein RIX1 n=1 Tax=Galerina marginata (strain CBS 339.88) TaxID=685588 RepID=A0A067TL34_GALM3|nr:hypothetical protein GALMADRAFT_54559 [Galerina marginata CBS 339.88]
MEPGSHLKYLLQSQLASDASATRYLPYCLSTLTAESFLPSSHLTKWTTRIHALIHSKDLGTRWAGLCLAYKTALLSQNMMVDSAQSWITGAFPVLSRSEPLPTLKAAIRLLRVILTTAIDIPEFHRQICIPNVVKFTSAVISVAENHPDLELNIMCMETLARMVTLYPTTHRPTSAALFAFCLRRLNGSVISPTNEGILEAASRLYAVLPLTGGKVGAVNLWRKSVDETLAFGWEAFHCLRTTFPVAPNVTRPVPGDDPQVAIPLHRDRLRCSVITIQSLLKTVVHRPVQVPMGNLVKFIFSLLNCSVDGFIDPSIRAMEISVIPDIWTLGCDLLACIAGQFPYRLDSYSGRLLSILAFQLEQKPNTRSQRLSFLKVLDSLLKNCHPADSSILPTRLAKAVLPSITKILVSSSSEGGAENEPSSGKSRNGKKRARNYEGDEVFKTTRLVIYPTEEEGEACLISLDVIQSLFRNPNLASAAQSIIARVIIAILISLPRMAPSSLSSDPTFMQLISDKMENFSFIIGSGTTSVMSKTLPFVIEAALTNDRPKMQRDIGMLLHPRVPPLVRSMPHVESLSLFKAEESQEEAEAVSNLEMASSLHLHNPDEGQGDVVMEECASSITAISNVHEQLSTTTLGPAPFTTVIQQPPKSKAMDRLLNTPSELPPDSQTQDNGQTSGLPPSQKITTVFGSSTGPATESKIGMPSSMIPSLDNEDEDEEMPPIDIESDSEVEED